MEVSEDEIRCDARLQPHSGEKSGIKTVHIIITKLLFNNSLFYPLQDTQVIIG